MTQHTTFDADTLDMLRASLRHVLTEQSDRPLSDRLADLGWDEVLADDASTAMRTLFELKGETLSTADALGPSLARTLALQTGDTSLGDVLVAFASPYGPSAVSGGEVHIDAIALSPPAGRRVAHLVGGRLMICSSQDLAATSLGAVDDAGGALRLTGTAPVSDVGWIDGYVWNRLVAHGRWLLACELVGIGRHVIAGAVEYTKVRVQYGKPIGVFQALQHRLASAHAMIVGAGHLAAEAGSAEDEWSALVAKCMAGQAAEFACTQAQQCYGAIGFTWEHEFHRYLRRTYALDRMLGDWRSLEHEIGASLQESGVVPRIGSL
jgi:Acyl-CoA dehydrogenase, C-terminal domain